MRWGLAAVLALALAAAASAHDSYLLPESWTESWDVEPGLPGRLHLTSSETFPILEYGPEASRIVWSELRTPRAAEQLKAGMPTATSLPLQFTAADAGVAVAAVTLGPTDIDLEPSAVGHYFEEIGASQEARAAYAALGRAAALHERYTKHVKALVCVEPCSDRRAALTPSGQALEFVELPSYIRNGAPVDRRFRLLFEGEPLAGQHVDFWDGGGAHVALTTDANGAVAIGAPSAGAALLSAVLIRPPTAAGERFTTDFATLTFEVR